MKYNINITKRSLYNALAQPLTLSYDHFHTIQTNGYSLLNNPFFKDKFKKNKKKKGGVNSTKQYILKNY